MFTWYPFSRPVWRYSACVFLFLLTRAPAGSQRPPPTKAQNTEGAFVVPLTYDPITNQLPTVRVRIDHSAPLVFGVDTGTPLPLLIFGWAARQLRLKKTPDFVPLHNSTGFHRLYMTSVHTLDLVGSDRDIPLPVDLTLAEVTDYAFNDNLVQGPPIAGFIGTPVLANYVVDLDFQAKTMKMSPSQYESERPAISTFLPLQEERGHYSVQVKLGSEADVALQLDTGAALTKVAWTVASALSPSRTGEHAVGIGVGWATYKVLLLPTVLLGTFSEPNVAVYTANNPAVIGRLGMDLLRRFRVTMDLRNRRLSLVRASDYPLQVSRLPAVRCISLTEHNRQYFVDGVMGGSPAAIAGVQKGDGVIAVDGQPLNGMRSTPANRLITGFAGTQAHLVLTRGKQRDKIVAFERPSIFQNRAVPSVTTR